MYYEHIFRQLNKCRVRYLVAGGVAIVLHGIMRFTADLDLFVDLNPENWDKFVTAMNKMGYRPKGPIKAEDFALPKKRKKWIKEKGMKVFSFYHKTRHLELIDVFVKEYVSFDSAYKRKKIVKVKNTKIPLVSIKDLKALKKIASRSQDLADIDSLMILERVEKRKKKK